MGEPIICENCNSEAARLDGSVHRLAVTASVSECTISGHSVARGGAIPSAADQLRFCGSHSSFLHGLNELPPRCACVHAQMGSAFAQGADSL